MKFITCLLTLLLCTAMTFAQTHICTTQNPNSGITPVQIEASTNQGPSQTCYIMDNDLTTFWGAQNTPTINQTVIFELQPNTAFDQVQIAFHDMQNRKSFFQIQISNDYSNWTTIPVNGSVDGESTIGPVALETFDLGAQNATFIRFVAKGTDYVVYSGSNTHNQVREFRIVNSSGSTGGGNGGEAHWTAGITNDEIFYTTGNVGIATTNIGDWQLAVGGKIRAEEIKVETGWADYVFKSDYNLPSLAEVEKHIAEKGHLINIPSAAEVEANGILLGDMNRLLLEKIEELTLYIIELDKKGKKQYDELIQLRKDVKHLK